jgi:hypothetical protein
VSSIKRIIDLAKSNLNSLLERAAETADPRRRLASIPDAELEAELSRRRTARQADAKLDEAKARLDGGARPPADRAEREKTAREREERVRAARAGRDQAARQAEEARRNEEARRAAASARASAGARAGARPSSGGGASTRGKDPLVVRYYERLEIPYGSDWETVKTSYRKLMRKYHPDLHGHKSPEKLKAATEVSQALTQAYNELEKVLVGGPNRKV